MDGGMGRAEAVVVAGGSVLAELHVLVCQRYRLRVRRGDHEADARGADGISSAVCHLPDVPAVLLQGVVGSTGYLALGDRNGQRPQVRMCLPPRSTRGTTQHLPCAETSCPAAPSLQCPAQSRASAHSRAGTCGDSTRGCWGHGCALTAPEGRCWE